MRVRIQYSVDFDEVPDKVGVFLKNVADGLLEVSKNLRQEADIIKDGHSNPLSRQGPEVPEDVLPEG